MHWQVQDREDGGCMGKGFVREQLNFTSENAMVQGSQVQVQVNMQDRTPELHKIKVM
jgi:hypothetical protein